MAKPFAGAGQGEGQIQHGGEQRERRGMGDVGLQQQIDGQMSARGIARDDGALGRQRRPRASASPIRCGHRLRRWGIGARGAAGSRRKTPADRSGGKATRSAGGGCAVSTGRSRCHGRSRSRNRCGRAATPGAVDPFTDDAAAVGRSGVDRVDVIACQRWPEGVHDAGHDLAGQPIRSRPAPVEAGADRRSVRR